MGESRLALEALDIACRRGMVGERAAATESARQVPFGALSHLLRLPAVSGDALELFQAARHSLLDRLGPGRAVLVVDDAHLLDDLSAALLHQLALAGEAFVVAAVRTGAACSPPDAVVALWKDELAVRVEVGPLDVSATRQVAEEALGWPVGEQTARQLRRVTRGNPLFLRELLLSAQRSGSVAVDAGVWRLTLPHEPSERLVDVVELRLAAVDGRSRTALGAAGRGRGGQLGRPGRGMIDRCPAAIARCAGAADVMAVLEVARSHGVPLSVKGGGHNVAGKAVCDDGLMVDLSPMRAVRVDPAARRAFVQPGATWADVDHETQAFALATTGGTDSRTGVAGLTLGGGIGFLARRYGLTADNLVRADVVTADGELVRASAEENQVLWWALRGGGGNLGIVTEFEYQLHEVGPDLLVAQAYHRHDDIRDVLRSYRDYMKDAPDEVGCYAIVIHVPPVEPFPPEHHGATALAVVASYAGSADDGRAVLEPVVRQGDPILADMQPIPYTALQQSFDAGAPDGARYYFKSHFIGGLPDEAIDVIADGTDPLPGPLTAVALEPMGGAINRVDPSSTAWPHRDAAFNFGVFPGWSDPAEDDRMRGWARDLHAAMAPWSTGGVYVNYLDDDEPERVHAAYGDHYRRLAEIKQRWDPQNLFRANQNVRPLGG